jgi:hypothetical protein
MAISNPEQLIFDLSDQQLTPDQHLVPLCREANGNLLENLSLQELRTWSAGG